MSTTPPDEPSRAAIGSAYPAFKLAQALIANARSTGSSSKVRQWIAVLENIFAGTVDHGSRTPVDGVPAWVTLEVVTGGFATGALAAGGLLQPHEQELLATLPEAAPDSGRLALNTHFLTDAGFETLNGWLDDGCYRISVPEESALLTVAWLARHDRLDEALTLTAQLAPHFSRLRFYPAPSSHPPHPSGSVHLQTAGEALARIAAIEPDRRVLAQRAAVDIWAPIHDRVVGMFLEIIEDGWPGRPCPEGWRDRAARLIDEMHATAAAHGCRGKAARPNGHQAQLRHLLETCVAAPHALTAHDIARVRHIVQCCVAKRGAPGSAACMEARARARADVCGPLHADIAALVAQRLRAYPADAGIEDPEPLGQPVSGSEATASVPAATPIPSSIRRKARRCRSDTPERLIAAGLITSGDKLAEVLPQLTATLHSAYFTEPALGMLYAETYRAFRRRRSLLLLNMQKQVQFHELPWVAAMEGMRAPASSTVATSRQHLVDIASLALRSFPQALIPNKLLQELRALAADAQPGMPLVEELAADIFAGAFSEKFVAAAQRAAGFLDGSLYARYYRIDYSEIAGLAAVPASKDIRQRNALSTSAEAFAAICSRRANATGKFSSVASNGMLIEQQQILTTQNLAVLWHDLELHRTLSADLANMCRHCFRWMCGRLAGAAPDRHADLIRVKNSAYAWRQMVFFLTMMDRPGVDAFLAWAGEHLGRHAAVLPAGLPHVLQGLIATAHGTARENRRAIDPFTGWTEYEHPLAGRHTAY
ncbi:hypothetical protein [Pseudoduganella albidiflava]|uniref:Uncharacterized protein n=1 Tax=Pseudoduganella albidiflava TaxID=321983 RepID=A0A411WTM8_9BURK|nr:hypothetical protein [Pseudoduganella albidiflava]QBH99991.1 hypothetical protein EYF70_03365 [Pseudoduganella albidiflava]GGY55374.1 hypothetical protein GCM10007387_42400 [Pseudoduganella albidiflava]